jgi:hypothetical protein
MPGWRTLSANAAKGFAHAGNAAARIRVPPTLVVKKLLHSDFL